MTTRLTVQLDGTTLAGDELDTVLEVAAEVAASAADEARTERDRRLVAERLGRVGQAAGVTGRCGGRTKPAAAGRRPP